MDKDITVRFYELRWPEDGPAGVADAFRDLAALPRRDRERAVNDEIVLRLDDFDEGDGLIWGDIVRVQSDNLPSHVQDDSSDPLPVDRIGHHAAFVFEPETRFLALQFDIKIAVNRFCTYASEFCGTGIGHMPVFRPNTLERFEAETPTSFTVGVSGVRNFAGIGADKTDLEDQLEEWANFFGGMNIEIKVSTRSDQGGLDKETVLRKLHRFLVLRERIEGVRKIKANTIESDKAFNFVNDLLVEYDTLALLPNDPEYNRQRRLDFVRECYDEHRPYLRRIAGVA
tara:strand:+ start:369 stop:1223 length:855 start_codon:yes stop_codon:yes gene_type:complete